MLKRIGGVLILAIIISYILLRVNEKQFDQNSWHDQPLKRYKMSKDIIASGLLVGKSKDEVIGLLGKADSSALIGKEHLIFRMGKPPSFFESTEAKLVIIFENDRAMKVIHSHE